MVLEADVALPEPEGGRDRRPVRRPFQRLRKPRQVELGEGRPRPPRDGAAHIADLLLQYERRVRLAAGPFGERDRRAHRGVAGEGQLAPRHEDADRGRMGGVARRLDEHRLRQVELARDRLHRGGVEPLAIEHHRQRIAGQRCV